MKLLQCYLISLTFLSICKTTAPQHYIEKITKKTFAFEGLQNLELSILNPVFGRLLEGTGFRENLKAFGYINSNQLKDIQFSKVDQTSKDSPQSEKSLRLKYFQKNDRLYNKNIISLADFFIKVLTKKDLNDIDLESTSQLYKDLVSFLLPLSNFDNILEKLVKSDDTRLLKLLTLHSLALDVYKDEDTYKLYLDAILDGYKIHLEHLETEDQVLKPLFENKPSMENAFLKVIYKIRRGSNIFSNPLEKIELNHSNQFNYNISQEYCMNTTISIFQLLNAIFYDNHISKYDVISNETALNCLGELYKSYDYREFKINEDSINQWLRVLKESGCHNSEEDNTSKFQYTVKFQESDSNKDFTSCLINIIEIISNIFSSNKKIYSIPFSENFINKTNVVTIFQNLLNSICPNNVNIICSSDSGSQISTDYIDCISIQIIRISTISKKSIQTDLELYFKNENFSLKWKKSHETPYILNLMDLKNEMRNSTDLLSLIIKRCIIIMDEAINQIPNDDEYNMLGLDNVYDILFNHNFIGDKHQKLDHLERLSRHISKYKSKKLEDLYEISLFLLVSSGYKYQQFDDLESLSRHVTKYESELFKMFCRNILNSLLEPENPKHWPYNLYYNYYCTDTCNNDVSYVMQWYLESEKSKNNKYIAIRSLWRNKIQEMEIQEYSMDLFVEDYQYSNMKRIFELCKNRLKSLKLDVCINSNNEVIPAESISQPESFSLKLTIGTFCNIDYLQDLLNKLKFKITSIEIHGDGFSHYDFSLFFESLSSKDTKVQSLTFNNFGFAENSINSLFEALDTHYNKVECLIVNYINMLSSMDIEKFYCSQRSPNCKLKLFRVECMRNYS